MVHFQDFPVDHWCKTLYGMANKFSPAYQLTNMVFAAICQSDYGVE